MIEKLKKIRIDIIALLLLPICPHFIEPVGAVVISVILLIIYFISAKRHYFLQMLFLFLYIVGIIFAYGGLFLMENMENNGIDGIGEALVCGMISNLGVILLIGCPIIICVIDNAKSIFRKKNLKLVGILGIVIFLYFPLHILFTTTRVSKNIPTVGDFEKELIQRGFTTSTTDYRLYGIKSTNQKAIRLSFKNNNLEKYPLYVFSIIDYPWLIYYANGDMYAVRGKYWDQCVAYNECNGYNKEKIIWDHTNEIISEIDKITVYNTRLNRYESGNIIYYVGFNYYSRNESIENSIFIDIPCVNESFGAKVKQIDKIDISSLNKLYVNNN